MYAEQIALLARTFGYSFVKIQPPCPEKDIAAAEKAVGYPFPKELRDLLREMNGDNGLLLSAAEIADTTLSVRDAFRPLYEEDFGSEAYTEQIARLILFGSNGCGDYYGYRVDANGIPDESAIILWQHEELGEPDCIQTVARNMTELIARYYNNEI